MSTRLLLKGRGGAKQEPVPAAGAVPRRLEMRVSGSGGACRLLPFARVDTVDGLTGWPDATVLMRPGLRRFFLIGL